VSENIPRLENRHATMADVAAHIGVSRQLVGLAFRGAAGVSAESAVRIFAAAEEIGYQPNLAAQALRREGSKYIGVTYHTSHSSTEELLPAIYKEAATLGYKVMLSAISHDRDDQEAVNEIIGHRCDGVILISTSLPIAKLQRLSKTMPLVSLSRRINGVKCGVVASEGESGMFDAVQHLVALGHESIAYVDVSEMFDHEYRLQGYREAIAKSRLTESVISISGDYIETAGAKAAEIILSSKSLPTAVICANDQVALGLVYTLQKAGLGVPKDISVVGFDDTIARLPFLDFTTVHQDATELAKAAVADLASRIEWRIDKPQTVLTSAKLVIRSSTAAPRASK
jgi:DNA-binding LacI/PurR family transcriptional regulator